MDKLVELLGKILEKLTSAKLLWTVLIAVLIFGLTYMLVDAGGGTSKPFGIGCFATKCSTEDWIGLATLAVIALIVAAIVVWVAGRVKSKYFV